MKMEYAVHQTHFSGGHEKCGLEMRLLGARGSPVERLEKWFELDAMYIILACYSPPKLIMITDARVTYAPISGMPYTSGWQERNWHILIEKAPILGAQSWVPSPYISPTSTPYLPVVHSVWQEDMGNSPGIFLRSQRWKMQFELDLGQFPQQSANPLGKIPTANPFPFSNICPRYAWWHIPMICALYIYTLG